jgi:two-component system nitrogen regulation response regulator GlnG
LPDGGLRLARQGERMDVAIKDRPCPQQVDLAAAEVERGCVVVLGGAVALMLHPVELSAESGPSFGLIGASRCMRDLRADIRRVADQDVPVLLLGETGVGKELVASAIHEHGARARGPYVPVNMAAIPSSMAEAELFGYVRGAFTGASQARAGYFALANGGTLFLDEIGDAPADVQAKLLRITEHKELQPLGGRPQKIDVRLIAATDSDLERAIADGAFRRPLLERLSGYPIRIPPLRERRDDIPRLFLHFLRAELARLGEADKLAAPAEQSRPWLPLRLVLALLEHAWPGNVRELFNTALQLALANRGDTAFRVPEAVAGRLAALRTARPGPSAGRAAEQAAGTRRSVKPARELSDEDIVAALEHNGYNLSRTAAELDISRTTLHTRLELSPVLRKASDLEPGEIARALTASGGDVGAAAAALRVSERGLVLHMRKLDLSRGADRD